MNDTLGATPEDCGVEAAYSFDNPVEALARRNFPDKACVILYRRSEGKGVEDEDLFVSRQFEGLLIPIEQFTNYCVNNHVILVCRTQRAARSAFEMFPREKAPKAVLLFDGVVVLTNEGE